MGGRKREEEMDGGRGGGEGDGRKGEGEMDGGRGGRGREYDGWKKRRERERRERV